MIDRKHFFTVVLSLPLIFLYAQYRLGGWRDSAYYLKAGLDSLRNFYRIDTDTLFLGKSPNQVIDFSNANYLVFPPGDVVFNVIRPETFLTGTKLGKSGYNYDSAYVLHISSDSGYVKMPKVKTNYVVWDLVQTPNAYGFYITAGGTYSGCYGSLHGAVSDSIIIDSIHVVIQKNDANVYIDSIEVMIGTSRTSVGVFLWADGTDRATGSTPWHHFNLYPNLTISTDWRLYFRAFPGGTSGTVYFYSIKCYGHYK